MLLFFKVTKKLKKFSLSPPEPVQTPQHAIKNQKIQDIPRSTLKNSQTSPISNNFTSTRISAGQASLVERENNNHNSSTDSSLVQVQVQDHEQNHGIPHGIPQLPEQSHVQDGSKIIAELEPVCNSHLSQITLPNLTEFFDHTHLPPFNSFLPTNLPTNLPVPLDPINQLQTQIQTSTQALSQLQGYNQINLSNTVINDVNLQNVNVGNLNFGNSVELSQSVMNGQQTGNANVNVGGFDVPSGQNTVGLFSGQNPILDPNLIINSGLGQILGSEGQLISHNSEIKGIFYLSSGFG